MTDNQVTEQTHQADMPAGEYYHRFSLYHRIEHWVFMISFSILGLTGLVQKFPEAGFSKWIVNDVLGGIENTRWIHHTAATVMMIVVVYHVGAIIYRVNVERKTMTMLPGVVDLKAASRSLGYYFGFRKDPAQQGRYSFEEKAEYWAVVWGTVIMAITGFAMWNPITTSNYLPGEVIPAAKAAHGAEAILAVAAIFLWHFYHVLVKTSNKSMFNGKLNAEQMLEEHPIELADIKAGIADPTIDAEKERRRKRIFWPSYAVFTVIGFAAIFWFVNHETTALTTIPPAAETVEVFVPLTPTPFPTPRPSATPAPVTAVTWDGGIGALFSAKCSACHNSTALAGGLDLTSYAGAMAGGNSGPVIIPSDAQNSKLVQIQQAGGHPGQLSPDELELVIEWINAGAPEK